MKFLQLPPKTGETLETTGEALRVSPFSTPVPPYIGGLEKWRKTPQNRNWRKTGTGEGHAPG
jgi:hypothetical protein